MRIRKMKNVSNHNVSVKQPSGAEFMLTPGNSVENVQVSNLKEVLGDVSIKHDLTEVVTPGAGNTRING